MKTYLTRGTQKFATVLAGLSFSFLLVGCAGPISKTSRMMQKTTIAANLPTAAESLVYIHRPRARQGHPLYANIWDGKKLIADLGNGHALAYRCTPGKHNFICRSVEVVSVIDANLEPGKTYDLWVDTAGAWIASFKMKPIKKDDKLRKKIAAWEKECLWVAPAPNNSDYEQKWSSEIDLILNDFTAGKKRERLQVLAADDSR